MLALQERTYAALNHVVVATEINAAECCLDQQGFTHSESNPCAGRLPEVPEASEKKEWLPESFDELVVYLNQEFGRLAADVEHMAKELCEAQEASEQLRHRLLAVVLLEAIIPERKREHE